MEKDTSGPHGMSQRSYRVVVIVLAAAMFGYYFLSGGAPTVERSDIDESQMGVGSLRDISKSSAYLFRHFSPEVQFGTAEAILANNDIRCGDILRMRGPVGSTDTTSYWRMACDDRTTDLLLGLDSIGFGVHVTDCTRAWFTVRWTACGVW